MGKSKKEKRQAYFFDNKTLLALILPLVVEQLLAVLVGMADSIMIAMHFQHWLREEQSLRGSSWDRTDGKKPVSRQRRWYGLSRSVQSALQCLYIWENLLFYIQYLEKSTRM